MSLFNSKNAGPVIVIILAVLLLPDASYGYIDPGSGHLLWQAMLAAIFGSLYFIRQLFSRSFWSSLFRKKPVEPSEAPLE